MNDRELMQQALFKITYLRREHTDDEAYAIEEALRARLAQPEPEPVAWRMHDRDRWCYLNHINHLHPSKFEPLYTAPPQREWQGLTAGDWPLPQFEYSSDFQIGAQWAEATLREKNSD